MVQSATLALCILAAAGVMADSMLTMEFGPPSHVVTDAKAMKGKVSNTLDLYPDGFADAGLQENGTRTRALMAVSSVDGGKTFQNVSFQPTVAQTWTSFAMFKNGSGHPWAHDFGTANQMLIPPSLNSTSVSSNSSFSYRFDGGVLMRTPGPGVKFTGFPVPFCPLEPVWPDGGLTVYASSHINLPDGTHLQTGMTHWCRPPLPKSCAAIVAFTSKDGYNYDYVGNVSTCLDVQTQEGPNEHDCALLPSGEVMCVIRSGAGMWRNAGSPFYMTKSLDGGKSWSKRVALVDTDGNAMGSARPQLLQLGNSTLLSGGRTMMGRDHNDGFSVWLSEDAGKTWKRADVSYHHNAKASITKVPLFPAAVNTSGYSSQLETITTGYSGLVRVGDMSATLLYDIFVMPCASNDLYASLHPPYCIWSYTMRIDLVPAMQQRSSTSAIVNV